MRSGLEARYRKEGLMANEPRPLVAGNWKMNGFAASIA
jgi:hypothetical protein